MFAKFAVLFSIAVLVAAGCNDNPATTTITVTAGPTSTQPASQCNTGPVQCCYQVEPSDSLIGNCLLELLGIALSGPGVPIGLTCSPISIVGILGAGCNAQTVCCENNSYNGVIAIGCFPVNLLL